MRRTRPAAAERTVIRGFARGLRRQSTSAEKLLWTRLQGDRLGARFRRQYRVESFILDFACPTLKIAVELDGDSHDRKIDKDQLRDEHLRALGFVVLRFSNQEVFEAIEAVEAYSCTTIQDRRKTTPSPCTQGEGGGEGSCGG